MTQEVLRTAKVEPGSTGKTGDKDIRFARRNHARSRSSDSNHSCPLCKRNHFLPFCEQYKQKSAQEKREIVATYQRCWNCLGRHLVVDCSSSKSCSKCSARHHTTLHDALVTVSLPGTEASSSSIVQNTGQARSSCNPLLLATARVLVLDRSGAFHSIRALLDPGSETSLISESLTQRLRLPRTSTTVAIYGVSGYQSGCSRGRVSMTLFARTGRYSLAVSALMLPDELHWGRDG